MTAPSMMLPSLSWWQELLCILIGYGMLTCSLSNNARPEAILHVVSGASFGFWGNLRGVFSRDTGMVGYMISARCGYLSRLDVQARLHDGIITVNTAELRQLVCRYKKCNVHCDDGLILMGPPQPETVRAFHFWTRLSFSSLHKNVSRDFNTPLHMIVICWTHFLVPSSRCRANCRCHILAYCGPRGVRATKGASPSA